MDDQYNRTNSRPPNDDTRISLTLSAVSTDSMTDRSTLTFKEAQTAKLLQHQRSIRLITYYILVSLLALLCITLIIGFVVVPVIFAHWVFVQRLAMFTNIGLPTDPKYYDTIPDYPKLIFRNFHLDFLDGSDAHISLGVWQFLQYSLYPNASDPNAVQPPTDPEKRAEWLDVMLRNNTHDVVIYFHGSGECRRDSLMMYNVLLRFFHLVTFDYRDYGDSTPSILSEADVAADAVHVFQWVRERTNRKIYVWGHSLGTPLGTLTMNVLPEELQPHGLILESPMTNMNEEISLHPYGKLFAWLPWFDQTIRGPLKRNGFLFATDRYILNVSCPIMILHAEDDSIIPYTLGKKLAQIATDNRPPDYGGVTYVQFPAHLRLDHFRIYKSKRLPTLIYNFTDICDKYANGTNADSDEYSGL